VCGGANKIKEHSIDCELYWLSQEHLLPVICSGEKAELPTVSPNFTQWEKCG
jgi:hypothetical protein